MFDWVLNTTLVMNEDRFCFFTGMEIYYNSFTHEFEKKTTSPVQYMTRRPIFSGNVQN